MTGSVDDPIVVAGGTNTFTYVPTNNSSTPVRSGVRVKVTFPDGLTPTDVDTPYWDVEIDGQVVTLTRTGQLFPGETLPDFSITTVASMSPAGPLLVTTHIETIEGEDETTLANNDAPLSVTVQAEPTTTTTTTTPTPTPTSPSPTIPPTGGTPTPMLAIAAALFAAGLAATGITRRKLRGQRG